MWLVLAFVSATFLGFYDTSKKASLKGNAVLPVLFLNTVFSTLIFSPFLLDYIGGFGWFSGTFLDTTPFPPGTQSTDTHSVIETACSPLTARSFSNILTHRTLAASTIRWIDPLAVTGLRLIWHKKVPRHHFTIW